MINDCMFETRYSPSGSFHPPLDGWIAPSSRMCVNVFCTARNRVRQCPAVSARTHSVGGFNVRPSQLSMSARLGSIVDFSETSARLVLFFDLTFRVFGTGEGDGESEKQLGPFGAGRTLESRSCPSRSDYQMNSTYELYSNAWQ